MPSYEYQELDLQKSAEQQAHLTIAQKKAREMLLAAQKKKNEIEALDEDDVPHLPEAVMSPLSPLKNEPKPTFSKFQQSGIDTFHKMKANSQFSGNARIEARPDGALALYFENEQDLEKYLFETKDVDSKVTKDGQVIYKTLNGKLYKAPDWDKPYTPACEMKSQTDSLRAFQPAGGSKPDETIPLSTYDALRNRLTGGMSGIPVADATEPTLSI